MFRKYGQHFGLVGRWWSGQFKRPVFGIDGVLLLVVIGDGKLIIPVDFAIRRPNPKGPGRRCHDKLYLTQNMLDERLVVFAKRGVTLPPPIIVADSWFSDSKLMGHVAAVPWCCVNSIYYFDEDAARTLEDDFVGAGPYFIRQLRVLLADADLVLHGTDIEFDPPPLSLPAHHHYAGPLLWEPPGEVPSFLTEPGAPWVLVSLSSLPQADELTLARAALQALAEQPVRVVLTLTETHSREELGAIPANTRLAHYIPHTELLKHRCLLVSHSGHGIVSKALTYGVPMVLVPWGRDQPGVAARAAALGVAEVVQRDEFAENEERLGIAIRQVLETSSYREQVERVSQRLQTHDTVAEACGWIAGLFAGMS